MKAIASSRRIRERDKELNIETEKKGSVNFKIRHYKLGLMKAGEELQEKEIKSLALLLYIK